LTAIYLLAAALGVGVAGSPLTGPGSSSTCAS